MPLSKSFSSDENFIFFSAPDLNVHEPSISYVKSCRALWKQGNTSIIGRDQRNIYNQASIEATPEVLTSEVSSILYISCFSFKHFGLWETVLPSTAAYMMTFFSKGNRVMWFMKDLKGRARTRTKSLRKLLQFLIVLCFSNWFKGAIAQPISNARMLQLKKQEPRFGVRFNCDPVLTSTYEIVSL